MSARVHADLTLRRGAGVFRLTGDGRSLALDVPGAGALWRLARSVRGRRARRALAERLDALLGALDLTLELRVAGRPLLRYGAAGSRPWWARVLGA